MSWRPTDTRSTKNRRGSPLDRLDQAKKARADQLAYKQAVISKPPRRTQVDPAPSPRPARDATVYLEALRDLPLWRLGDTHQMRVSENYLKLAETALEALESNERLAVLCWPECAPSPSALTILLSLADCAVAPKVLVDGIEGRAAPLGLRALIYPYARTAHRNIRQVYVDKDHIGHLNTLHQLRVNKPGEDEGLADFHKVLARAKTLTGLALDGQTYDEFRHPCFDELIPFGPCQGDEGRLDLLWRVRSKTDLKAIKRSGEADDPAKAKYYLFGLRPKDRLVPALRALNKQLDIVFLDLTAQGRARLGRDWVDHVRAFLEQLDARVGQIATVALTDDPWSFDTLRFNALLRGNPRKTKAPVSSRLVFSASPDIVQQDSLESVSGTFTPIRSQEVAGYSGDLERVLRSLRSNAHSATEIGDRQAAELLRQVSGIVRRCASLPASRSDLSDFIRENVGDGLGASDIEANYRLSSQIRQLRELTGPWSQRSRESRDALLVDVEQLWENTSELTPMAPLLRDVVARFLNKSSATALLFAKDMLVDLATHALCKDAQIGDDVRTRIDKGMLLFVDRNDLADIDRWPGPRRNYVKTLIVVAPTRAQLLKTLAREWLPDNLIVLGDNDALASAAADAQRLAGYRELATIADRLTGYAAAASHLVHRFKAQAESGDNVDEADFPMSSVVNLVGGARGRQSTIQLTLTGGQTLIARPNTKLIVQDASRTLPIFLEADAKDVELGDRVCVIGDAFLEMARPMLNITVRAAEEIRDYHDLVVEKFSALPGDTRAGKLAALVAAMGLSDVTVQRAAYWIDLEAQRQADLSDVVPHAPRDWQTFLTFMQALAISEIKARHYWTWAVIAQRSSRLRAAISFHEAYRTILVDNYAAQSSDPSRASEIRRLKLAAEDFVADVTEKTEIGADDAST